MASNGLYFNAIHDGSFDEVTEEDVGDDQVVSQVGI
jgi:hypothetical protein